MKQKSSETVDVFATRLRRKAERCDFTEKDKRTQISDNTGFANQQNLGERHCRTV